MKKIVLLVAILILLLIKVSQGRPKPGLAIISVKKHLVQLKVDESFVGGQVEIYDGCKNKLETNSIAATHCTIRFTEIPVGRYLVKVRNGKSYVEFEYINI